MQYNKIIHLIHTGSYDKAWELTEEMSTQSYGISLALKSRIRELNGYFDKAKNLAEKSLTWSEANNSYLGALEALVAYSYIKWRQFEFNDAYKMINRGLELSTKGNSTPATERHRASLLNIQGLTNWKESKFNQALISFESSLAIRKNLNLKPEIAYSLNNIGNTYLMLADYQNANDYFQQSLKLRLELGLNPSIAASFNSLGRYYDAIKDYNQALIYHSKSLALWEKIGNKQFIAKSYRFIALSYRLQNELNTAQLYFDKSLQLFEEIGNQVDIGVTLTQKRLVTQF
ncbi:MAG: tetratricopeptide repeat protein [Candidatus Kariarchaeaceae archaeon]